MTRALSGLGRELAVDGRFELDQIIGQWHPERSELIEFAAQHDLQFLAVVRLIGEPRQQRFDLGLDDLECHGTSAVYLTKSSAKIGSTMPTVLDFDHSSTNADVERLSGVYRNKTMETRGIGMNNNIVRSLSVLLLCGQVKAVSAQAGLPDPIVGQQLAGRLCASCHATDPDGKFAIRGDVPSFRAIAGSPNVTTERLAGSIIIPHPAMPGVPLTRAEVRDLVAYILSLKSRM